MVNIQYCGIKEFKVPAKALFTYPIFDLDCELNSVTLNILTIQRSIHSYRECSFGIKKKKITVEYSDNIKQIFELPPTKELTDNQNLILVTNIGNVKTDDVEQDEYNTKIVKRFVTIEFFQTEYISVFFMSKNEYEKLNKKTDIFPGMQDKIKSFLKKKDGKKDGKKRKSKRHSLKRRSLKRRSLNKGRMNKTITN